MTTPATSDDKHASAIPPIVDHETWEAALADLRAREKAATRELDAIAAARRRLPMVELPDYTLEGPDGPVRLVDLFEGKRQLTCTATCGRRSRTGSAAGAPGSPASSPGSSSWAPYDARFVIVTQGPIEEALAYKARIGNRMDWYSTANSPFGSDMGAPPGGGFQVNVFLRVGDTVYRTYNTQGRGVEQLGHTFALIDLLPMAARGSGRTLPPAGPNRPRTPAGVPPSTSPATPTAPPENRAPAGRSRA